jgi:hypothetical protein
LRKFSPWRLGRQLIRLMHNALSDGLLVA